MDFSLFLTIVAAAICFVFLRKLRFDPENQEIDPSSSSVSPPSSLSVSTVNPPHNWTYDVFPSFRGEDVRENFLSHIKKEFGRKGITPFIDDEMKRGESIGPELIQAIRGSKIAIIIFSQNYASSKWCLDELVEIMKCKEEELGQTVMPIFHKVDPSDVKKLAGDFGKVFKKTCEGKSKEDIERWTQALVNVATITGYDSRIWNNEATLIEKIATDVSSKLFNSAHSSDFDSSVGMEAHMEKMSSFLHLDFNEVKMIGIWGPSGIGKSTIARVLYSKHSHQFQLSVFMENVKRRYPTVHGYDDYSVTLQLQKDFLSQIINYEDIKDHHLGVAQDRLKDKRVFVVLDDVDHSMQLEAMAKETRWFGPGSRIIITTQDKKVLTDHEVNHIYEVDFPPDEEALQIFCTNAFVQKYPYDGFAELAWEVTKLAGKLPLGLRVMGSYLKRMPIEEWKKEVPRLQASLDGKIKSILEFSYNALGDEDKELFLYIACIFNNERIEKVEAHLANSQGLRILAEKSFISVTGSGDIAIHDLLARFGRDIVRRQSSQLLVDARDTCKVLNNNTTSGGSVIGAVLNFSEISEIADELSKCDNAVESMSCLQFLRLSHNSPPRNVLDWQYRWMTYRPSKFNPYRNTTQILKNLPRKVRLLDWRHFPMSFLPSNFNPEFLVELKMRDSELEKLWRGNKTIRNLKWMDLSGSKNLRKLPDLSTATNLQELDLTDCRVLTKLPSSIGNVTSLEKLDLRRTSLQELPSSIGNAINLKELNLYGCKSLKELPSSIGNVTSLEKLNLSSTSLRELPSSIGNAINLKELNLCGCESLMKLPSSIGNAINLKELNLSWCSSLRKLPSSIGNAINLTKLDLRYCSSLEELPSSIGNAINLTLLYLWGCKSLMELPSSIGNVTSLEKLDLSFTSLQELPSSIGNVTSLEKLDLSFTSLQDLPSSIGNAINLKELNLYRCKSLKELPSSIGNVTSLEKLNLSSTSLRELPSSIGNAINLKELNLCGCESLMKLPSSIGNAINLKELSLKRCYSLQELPSSIGNVTSLEKLNLSFTSLQELPSSIGNVTSLEKLDLSFTSLQDLPSSIGNAINLKELNLYRCKSLKELPSSIGNITSLEKLNLSSTSLRELPSSIGNAINLKELNLCGCESLMKLPSSIGNAINLKELSLKRCYSLQELPSSIGNAINLTKLNLNGCSSLRKLPSSIGNAINLTELGLRYCSSLEDLPSSIGNVTSLRELVISGCTKLVSLPQLPDSLETLEAEDCESLERLHCSFHNTRFVKLNFADCFKLNQEARDLIIKASSCKYAILPGEKVPPHFTYQAIGSSCSMKLNGTDMHLPTSLTFKACFVLVNKGCAKLNDWNHVEVTYRIAQKHNGISVTARSDKIKISGGCLEDLRFKKHQCISEFEGEVSSNGLVFEFEADYEGLEIAECGISILSCLVD